MTRAASARQRLSRQRGFWLRCFLGYAMLVTAVGFAVSGQAWGKVESQGTIHLWRLHGVLVSTEGTPLSNVEVTLTRNGAVAYRTRTDSSGRFAFDHVYGQFRMHVDRANYSELDREVIVGLETVELARKTLYVIAGPSACTDDCSSVYTNQSEFEKAIRRNTEHHY